MGRIACWTSLTATPVNGAHPGEGDASSLAGALLRAVTVREVAQAAADALPRDLGPGMQVVGVVVAVGGVRARTVDERWPAGQPRLDRLLEALGDPKAYLHACLESGRPLAVDRLETFLAPGVAPEERATIEAALGWGGGIAVPVLAGAEVVGVMLVVLASWPERLRITALRGAADLVGLALERARRASELETLVEMGEEAIGLYDHRGRLVRANSALTRLLGAGPETGGRPSGPERAPAPTLLTLDGTPLAREDLPVTRALRGEAACVRLQLVDADGCARAYEVTTTPLRDHDAGGAAGTTAGAVVLWRAIDHVLRRQQELEALIVSSRRLNVAIEQQAVLHAIVEAAADLVGADGAALGLVERRQAGTTEGGQLVYRDWYHDHAWQLMGQERAPWEGLAGRALATGEVQFVNHVGDAPPAARADAERDVPAGEVGDTSVLVLPIRSRSGAVLAAVTLLYNQSGRQFDNESARLLRAFAAQAAVALENARLYEGERRARQDLEGVREQREAFVAMVAHELKNPLTAILGNGQLLERFQPRLVRAPSQEAIGRAAHALERILDNGRRMQTMVDDLQEALRLGAGRFELHRDHCDAGRLITEVVEEQQATTERHHLVADTPPEPVAGHWDPEFLRRVLVNLVSNAIKYSPAGGAVRVGLRRGAGKAIITVSDDGIGIPPDAMQSLFEPYSRLYRDRHITGTGLGLYIVKGIVDAHGGAVRADSAGVDAGTTFTVTLPLVGDT